MIQVLTRQIHCRTFHKPIFRPILAKMSASAASHPIKFIDQVFAVDGSVTPDRLHELKAAGVKSVLSVAGETSDDPW
jgi:hypothetical protein